MRMVIWLRPLNSVSLRSVTKSPFVKKISTFGGVCFYLCPAPHRDSTIEMAIRQLNKSDILIRLAPAVVLAKWLERKRLADAPKITAAELSDYASRVYDAVGYRESVLARGVLILRAEASRDMGTTSRCFLFYLFRSSVDLESAPDYANGRCW